MTAATVLEHARAAGVRLLATPEGMIHWRGPGPLPEALRQAMALHKGELLALLAGDQVQDRRPARAAATDFESITAPLTVDEAERFAERVAIVVLDGLLSEIEAVGLAWTQTMDERRGHGSSKVGRAPTT
jgi:hypothetical protein